MKKIIFLSSVVFLVSSLKAQTDVYNAGQLYISNSTDTVYITGSLNNTNTAAFNNAGGNLYVLQNLNNDESGMVAGAGKLWFKGSALQTVSGSQPFRTYAWIADNTSGIALQNRLSIGDGAGGNLDFINGTITSGTNTQDVYFYPNGSYTGYSDSRHIIGYCSKSGSSDFTFPIGDGTLKADLDITNLSSSADFQCKYFGAGNGVYTSSMPLVSVFEKEYWILDRIAGTSSAQITLKWNDARKVLNHSAPSDLRVGHFTGASWVSEGGTGSGDAATGTVTSTLVNSYSPFTFASEGAVLPLLISNFEVLVDNNCKATLSWKSYDETEVSFYIIQKSRNGTNWQTVATLPVNVNYTNSANHSYTEKNTESGNWLYRVKAANINGSFIYTDTRLARLNCGEEKIVVYPTVSNEKVNIQIPVNLRISSIIIYNSNGQQVKKISNVNDALINIDINSFAAGEYTINIITNRDVKNFMFFKIN